jgi:hypothetical protein
MPRLSTPVRAALAAVAIIAAVVVTAGGWWDEVLNETLVGVVVGFALAQGGQFLTARRESAERNRSVRRSLGVEIDRNLRELEEAWRRLGADGGAGVGATTLAARLVDLPLPAWTRRLWEGRPDFAAGALDDQELVAVDRLYAALDRITGVRAALTRVAEEDAARQRSAPTHSQHFGAPPVQLPVALDFHHKAPPLWEAAAAAAREVRRIGNPLRVAAGGAAAPAGDPAAGLPSGDGGGEGAALAGPTEAPEDR